MHPQNFMIFGTYKVEPVTGSSSTCNYVDRDQRATTKPGHHPNDIEQF